MELPRELIMKDMDTGVYLDNRIRGRPYAITSRNG